MRKAKKQPTKGKKMSVTKGDAEKIEQKLKSGEIKVDLPEPGYKRDEVLAKRKDELEKEIEETADAHKLSAVNPEAVKEDREIVRPLKQDFLVLSIDPKYKLRWVNCQHHHAAAYLQARADGWQVVTKDMVGKEDHWKFGADGVCRLADVIAMCIPMEYWEQIQREQEDYHRRMQFGLEMQVYDMADKYGDKIKFHSEATGGDPRIMDQFTKRAARKTAMKHIGEQMKRGPIPGLPIR
jgi:hypothetical protein